MSEVNGFLPKVSGKTFLQQLHDTVIKNPILLHAIMANSNIAGEHDSLLLNDMEALAMLIHDAIEGKEISTI